MLPEVLKIKGLYSYQQEVTIEFEPLLRAGIFGIFGPVGSGKSTILEAITFALYGESNRLNARESRGYNMMNLNSNSLEIDFTFTHRQDRFRFKVQAKRQKSKFEVVKSPDRRAFRQEREDWVPLPSTDATELLGLKYEHFRQIVIIPQGKFQEFVHKSPTERSDMLQDLFPLDLYDLSDPLKRLRAQNSRAVTTIETQLLELDSATPEEIEHREQESKALETKMEQLQVEEEKLELQVREGDRIRQLAEKQATLEATLQTLKAQEKEIQEIEETLIRYETAQKLFGNLILRLHALQGRLSEAKASEEQYQQTAHEAEKEWIDLQKRKEEVQAHTGTPEEYLVKVQQLEAALGVLTLETQLRQGERDLTALQEQWKKVVATREGWVKELQQKRKRRTQLQPQFDIGILTNWKSSFIREDQLRERIEREQKRAERTKSQLDTLDTERQDLFARLEELDATYASWAKVKMTTALKRLKKEVNRLESEERKLEQQRQALLKKSGLASYAAELQEGEPCPLCGATHHPNLFQDDQHHAEITDLNIRLQMLGASRETLILAERDGLHWVDRQLEQEQLLDQQAQAIQEVQLELEDGMEARKALPPMKREAVERALAQAAQQEKELDKLQQSIVELEEQIEHKQEEKALADQVQQKRLELSRLETLLSEKSRQAGEEWKGVPAPELKKQERKLKTSYTELQELQVSASDLQQKAHEAQEAWNSAKEHVRFIEQEISEAELQFNRQLEQRAEFSKREEVEALLVNALDVEANRQRIAAFRKEWIGSNAALATIQEQMEGQIFDEEAYQIQANKLKENRQQQDTARTRFGELKGQIADLQQKMERKAKLKQEQTALELRRENLQLMKGLFDKRGFVQYVSTIYLRQLCALANDRFRKLTQNQLQLDLDEKNQFVVRDFLHQGHLRSIKTLSGGQTFQASLCLALALSEQIQGHQRIEQPFFFLDEGFGTLDRESLALVFSTLQQLRQENRTVGIISHVEDLQHEIDHFLLVQNDPEKGSSVRMHY